MFSNKPWTQQRKSTSRCHSNGSSKKLETIVPRYRRLTTATGPDVSSMTVDDVVVGDLIACSDRSAGDDVSDAVDRSHIRRGITRGVDVPFRRLHQNNAPAFEIVTVMRHSPGRRGWTGIYDATVIDSQDRFAEVVRSSGEDAKLYQSPTSVRRDVS